MNFFTSGLFQSGLSGTVRDYVRDGGGLAMLGGSRAFDQAAAMVQRAARGTARRARRQGKLSSPRQRACGVDGGRKAHPITRLLPDPKSNEETWSNCLS